MELVNATPVPARIIRGGTPDDERGPVSTLLAKATFDWSEGPLELETQDPVPLFFGDVETELGLLPSDRVAGLDEEFEVIVLGAAYAHGDKPVGERLVSLTLGETHRELLVTGDRLWESRREAEQPSPPKPFLRMPMTWERAYGGSCIVEIDREAFVEVQHPMNRVGRGADFDAQIAGIAEALQVPEGYPRWRRDGRLPNLEAPDSRLTSRSDDPLPACWATVPLGLGIHVVRAVDRQGTEPPADHRPSMLREIQQRAAPGLILPRAPAGSLRLVGAWPGEPLEFELPRLEVALDVELLTEAAVAHPRLLVLLPEQQRLYIVYRCTLSPDAGRAASGRLRVVPAAGGGR